MDCWNLWLLLLVTWNLELGPRVQETRRCELRMALTSCYKTRKPHTCPLFLEHLPKIVSELDTHNITTFPRVDSIESEAWQFLSDRAHFGSMGRRTCMSRYGASLEAALRNRGLWTTHLWERTFVALESDFLGSRKYCSLGVQQKEAASAGDGSTCTRGIALEEKAIRNAASNGVAISVMTLQQPGHQRIVDLICELCRALSTFMGFRTPRCAASWRARGTCCAWRAATT